MSITSTPEDPALLIQAIIHERDGLRTELIEYQKSMHKTIFAFITIAGIAASIYFGKGKGSGLFSKLGESHLLFLFISQVELFLALLGVTLIAGQSMHAGYIAALERKINALVHARVSVWESEIVPNFMGKPRGSFFWANILLVLFIAGIFGMLIYVVGDVGHWYTQILLSIELLAIIWLFYRTQVDTHRIGRFADKLLGNTRPDT